MSEVKNNNVTENKEATTPEKEDYTLDVEPIEFKAHAKTRFINSTELEKIINSIFAGEIAPDYAGCKIMINDPSRTVVPRFIQDTVPLNAPYLTLRFNRRTNSNAGPEDSNIVPKSMAAGKDYGDIARLVNVLGAKAEPASRLFTVTERTKEMLLEFVPDNMKNNPRWNERTEEHAIMLNDNMGTRQIVNVVEIYGLSLEKFLEKIYGSTVGEGDDKRMKYGYKINIMREIQTFNPAFTPTMYPNDNFEFLMQVLQMDWDTVDEVSNAVHMAQPIKDQLMYRLFNNK